VVPLKSLSVALTRALSIDKKIKADPTVVLPGAITESAEASNEKIPTSLCKIRKRSL